MRTSVTALVVGMCALGSVVSAQLPPQPPQSPRPTPAERPTARGSEGIVTLEGCLLREADVQGRWPKTPAKAGVTGDYVLTRAKAIKGTPEWAVLCGRPLVRKRFIEEGRPRRTAHTGLANSLVHPTSGS